MGLMDPWGGPEYKALLGACAELLRGLYQTENDVFIFPASGAGALEAAVVNTLSPGDVVLAVTVGVWGDRWARLAESFGLDVRRLALPRGRAVEVEQLRQALDEDSDAVAVLLPYDDTSTGVTNPLAELAPLVAERELLLLVDAGTSSGAIPLRADELGLDVVVGNSDEAWGMPAGLAMISISERAWAAMERARLPRYYWDLKSARSALQKGPIRFSVAPSALAQLRTALERIHSEGLPQVWRRHEEAGRRTRHALRELGAPVLAADERRASPTLTALKPPEGADAALLRARLMGEHGVLVLDGMAEMAGRVLRIPHLGTEAEREAHRAVEALRAVLSGGELAGARTRVEPEV